MKIYVYLLLVGYSTSLFALGQTGHRVTAEIAERHLSQQSKTAITLILGRESLAEASTYADEMRSNPAEFWQTTPPFHYVTVPKGKTYLEVGAPETGDALSALTRFSKTLVDPNASKPSKQIALKFIIHIIGDLHQPMHAGNGADRGGGKHKLEFFNQETNLHRIWDSDLIAKRGLSFTEWSNWLDKDISPKDIKSWQTNDPLVWIAEDIKIRNTIYPEQNSIGYDYLYNNLPIIKRRIKQAGIRMAYFLDQLFKDHQPK